MKTANTVMDFLGFPGCMLSGSKSAYSQAHPTHTVYFNACIFDDHGTQVWHGDLDLTLSADRIQEAADYFGTLHVTPEHIFRFYGFEEGMKRDPDRVKTFYRTEKAAAVQTSGLDNSTTK
jgi:hypothetical protein